MSEGASSNIVTYIVRLLFKLTAQLVVELIKMGILSVVILASLLVLLVAFILGLRWAFVAFNGSVVAVAAFGLCLVGLAFLSLLLLQYVVKDVMHLTDMSLWALTSVVVGAYRKNRQQSSKSKSKSQGEEPVNGNCQQSEKLD